MVGRKGTTNMLSSAHLQKNEFSHIRVSFFFVHNLSFITRHVRKTYFENRQQLSLSHCISQNQSRHAPPAWTFCMTHDTCCSSSIRERNPALFVCASTNTIKTTTTALFLSHVSPCQSPLLIGPDQIFMA